VLREYYRGLANAYLVIVPQDATADFDVVDKCAVRAVKILDGAVISIPSQFRVFSRNILSRQTDRAIFIAPHYDLCPAQWDRLRLKPRAGNVQIGGAFGSDIPEYRFDRNLKGAGQQTAGSDSPGLLRRSSSWRPP